MAESQLESWLPEFDVRSAHEIMVQADVASTYQALLDARFTDSAAVRTLLRIRNLGRPLPQRMAPSFFESLEAAGFLRLAFAPEREIVFGLAGKFWLPQAEKVTFGSAEEWARFNRSGYAKAAWNLSLEPCSPQATRLRTQTRVLCYGRQARILFRSYWFVVGPFSGMTRTALLRQVKRRAEAGATPNAGGTR